MNQFSSNRNEEIAHWRTRVLGVVVADDVRVERGLVGLTGRICVGQAPKVRPEERLSLAGRPDALVHLMHDARVVRRSLHHRHRL